MHKNAIRLIRLCLLNSVYVSSRSNFPTLPMPYLVESASNIDASLIANVRGFVISSQITRWLVSIRIHRDSSKNTLSQDRWHSVFKSRR